MKSLKVEELQDHLNQGGTVIDLRQREAFISGYIPGSIYIHPGLGLPDYFDKIIDKSSPLVIVAEKKDDLTSSQLFTKLGYEVIGSYLFDENEVRNAGLIPDLIIEVEIDEFSMDIKYDEKLVIVDLRDYSRYADAHVRKAISFSLNDFNDLTLIADLDERGCIYLYADNAYDPVTAASILKKYELHELRVVTVGWKAIKSEPSIPTGKSITAIPGKNRHSN